MAASPSVLPTAEPKVLRALPVLAPYVRRYSGRAVAAIGALLTTSLATLAMPLAIRRMIDVGFSSSDAAFVNRTFLALIALAGILALASAARYYLVMTLGERIVADLRRDVFAHLMRLSPAFFDAARSGEMISRLTADTTQIKSAVGASASIALRNARALRRRGDHDGRDEPAAFRTDPPRHPGDRPSDRRLRAKRPRQDALRAGPPRRRIRLRRRRRSAACGRCRPIRWKRARSGASHRWSSNRSRPRAARRCSARFSPHSRSSWSSAASSPCSGLGAHSVLAGEMSAGTLGQFLLYSVFAAGALARAQPGLGRGRPGGRRDRAASPNCSRRSRRSRRRNPAELCRSRRAARSPSTNVHFAYDGAGLPVLRGINLKVRPRRARRDRRSVRRRQVDALRAPHALLRSDRGQRAGRRRRHQPRSIRRRSGNGSASCRRIPAIFALSAEENIGFGDAGCQPRCHPRRRRGPRMPTNSCRRFRRATARSSASAASRSPAASASGSRSRAPS